ncbi:MAG: prepilin peptidase [Candidatus Aminicenantes bacterium]|nr:prepilin peptidase [Candidatus Aminicenantes bacterium]
MEKIIIVLFGLAWGSFLNVVIYRLPRGLSLMRPPSTCPQCGTRIKAYDNIPVLSYLLLRGKCRACGLKISVAYPLVELLTPACFLLLYARFSLSVPFYASCLFASALIALCFIDLYHQILPDEITLPGLALALLYSGFRPDMTLRQSLVGAVAGAGFLLIIYGAYLLLRKKEGLGMGDVTMMLLVGAYLGWVKAFFTLLVGSFVGALVGLFLMSFRKKDLQFALPFGTFLAPAAFFALVWGDRIINAYLSLYKR